MPISPKKRKSGQIKGVFHEIFVSTGSGEAVFGTNFVFRPENFEQKKLGTLFGVIKIDDKSSDSSYVVNLLASVLKKEYFSNPDRPADASFEAGLRKANLALAELARQGSVKWSGKINFAGGILEKNNLHFSKLGSTAILLLRGGQIADIGAGMGIEPEGTEVHPLKTFSDISSGKLEKNDCLIFSTSDLLEIFSLEELKQNAARFPRDEFPEILSASLTDNSELSAAIVVNLLSEEESALIDAETEKLKMEALLSAAQPATPEKTPPDEKISPARKPTHDIISPQTETAAPKIPARNGHLFTSESEGMPRRKSLLGKMFTGFRQLPDAAKNKIAYFWKKLFSEFQKINWRKTFSLFGSGFSLFVQWTRRIDWKNRKVQVGLGIFLAAVAGFAVFRIFGEKNIPPPAETADQNIAAPTSLNDREVRSVENIEEVAALSSDSQEITLMDGNIYSLTDDRSVARINPVNGETEKYDSELPSGKFSLITAMPDLKTIFILTTDRKIVSFTPVNKKFQENNISLPDNLNAADIKTFLTYMYILDPAANQIYRYPRAEGGFGEKQNWLKAGEDIAGARSFGINEDLFVASRNQITAYLQGKKDGKLNFESPDIPFVIDEIFTAPDFDNIYVLDNKNRRIAVYSKDGKIIAQYWNASLSGVKDFTIDEKNKAAYLLKTTSISKFSME